MTQEQDFQAPAVVQEQGALAINLMDINAFDQMGKIAARLAASDIIPVHFQKNPANVFVAMCTAHRMGVDLFMFMQASYVVHGKMGLEAKLSIALINNSGRFSTPIQWRTEGEEGTLNRKCTAFATDAKTGQLCEAECTMKMAKDEGWIDKNPKWKSMPELMLRYRSASFLGKLYCPDILMGMQSAEELRDIEPKLIGKGRSPRVELTSDVEDAEWDEPAEEQTFLFPEGTNMELLDLFLAETAKANRVTVEALKERAAANMPGFMDAFNAWSAKRSTVKTPEVLKPKPASQMESEDPYRAQFEHRAKTPTPEEASAVLRNIGKPNPTGEVPKSVFCPRVQGDVDTDDACFGKHPCKDNASCTAFAPLP